MRMIGQRRSADRISREQHLPWRLARGAHPSWCNESAQNAQAPNTHRTSKGFLQSSPDLINEFVSLECFHLCLSSTKAIFPYERSHA
jgi:hypothetical protein